MTIAKSDMPTPTIQSGPCITSPAKKTVRPTEVMKGQMLGLGR